MASTTSTPSEKLYRFACIIAESYVSTVSWLLFYIAAGLLADVACILCLLACILCIRVTNFRRRSSLLSALNVPAHQKVRIIGFFHPYCNAGGGGERVLWAAVKHMQETEPDVVSVVYSGDKGVTKEQIIEKVKARFDITLDPSSLAFVFLKLRKFVEDSTWPRFTLLGQSLGSIFLGWEAAVVLLPDLYIDTMGYAFTLPLFSILFSVPTAAYVHYPTISSEMISRVESRAKRHNNSAAIASSLVLSQAKLIYYRAFMNLYARSLRVSSFLMVNSSWTQGHVSSLVNSDPKTNKAGCESSREVKVVYPPCGTKDLSTLPLQGRERVILSLAQFRPEKDHASQLHAFKHLLDQHPEFRRASSGDSINKDAVSLVLIGGSRNEEDSRRVEGLKALAKELAIEDQVNFIINALYPDMLSWLGRASLGLSTMVDEHFGINIVEFMAAGVIPVAHASGGPLLDIIVPYDGKPTGYHATDPESFASVLYTALSMPPSEDLAMRERARTLATSRFSEEEFVKGWSGCGWKQACKGAWR